MIQVTQTSTVSSEDCAGREALRRNAASPAKLMAHTAGNTQRDDAAATAGRVLLVDDQPELRRLVRRSLIKAGYVVVEAWNGRVAVELAKQLVRRRHCDVRMRI